MQVTSFDSKTMAMENQRASKNIPRNSYCSCLYGI